MKPYKATKKDTTLNSIFTHTGEDLVPHLEPFFQATNMLNYYPQDWAITEILILKKSGKPDYTTLSAWQPIVLSDGMTRLLNSCQTEDIHLGFGRTRLRLDNVLKYANY
jgi:hypothetical protein